MPEIDVTTTLLPSKFKAFCLELICDCKELNVLAYDEFLSRIKLERLESVLRNCDKRLESVVLILAIKLLSNLAILQDKVELTVVV